VQYRVAYEGTVALELSASDLNIDYEASVSNSRCKPHTTPRLSHAHFALSEANSILSTVISNQDDRQRCRERITVAASAGAEPLKEPWAAKTDFLPLRLAAGQVFWLYITVEHDHFLYGAYDPLLGVRELEIRLGPCRLIDSIPLDAEEVSTMPLVKLSAPPHERLDPRQFHSAPDSLHLAIHEPGYQYFRFDDMPVRYGTEFKLKFWYLIAAGTEGTCHVRLTEYQDAPSAWYRLDGGFDEPMAVQGRWTQFEGTIRTRDVTTTMILDFRIVDANVGEMWIDDIELIARASDAKPDKKSRAENETVSATRRR
jgi:hypothetical protein